ncbi:MAG: RHS repeat-associated core domain-containing protein, partial [Chloroflexota bacterium]
STVTTPSYALTKYTFTGQYSHMDDPSTTTVTEGFGLMHYGARMYDPALGRFTSADTIIPSTQGVQGWDRFAYVNNNPLRYTDPTGHESVCGQGNSDPECEGVPHKQKPTLPPPSGKGKEKGDDKQPCSTLMCNAVNGDIASLLEIMFPSHFGLGTQFSFAGGFAEILGAGFEVSGNAIYYWRTDQLIITIDGGINGGVGVKVPIPVETSLTAGPIVGWGQSSPNAGNSAIGLGASASAIEAGTISVSVPTNIGLDGVNVYQDPYYGVIPATIYAGVGAGCCGAGASGSITGTIYTQGVSGVLPWNWKQ